MKAIIHTAYGSPDILELKEIDKPVPKDNEVLIKVYASSINDWDAGLLEGKPYFMRLGYGIFKPRNQLLGCDVAGTVESVGKNVKRFSSGDEVYGDIHQCGFGGIAEYVCTAEIALELKPTGVSFETAAAIPHAATLAWQGLFDKGHLQAGQTLLINGAGGGVGPIALQLAKLHGLEVTGVDSGEKLAKLRSLGFDHVINYKEQDFTRTGKTYDLVFDVKTNRSPFDYVRALKPNGTYVTVGGSMFRLLQVFIYAKWISKLKKRNMRILALDANRGLSEMAGLIESGKIKPLIQGPYTLGETPAAMRLFLKGEQQGRIVIKML